jgi:putative intracellular protease/amidase
MSHVLIPIPSLDFDPTEVAVSWQVLNERGHSVAFATPDGQPATGDELMISGQGLDPWGRLPGLRRMVVIGRFLRADERARSAYQAMVRSDEFRAPLTWEDASGERVDGLLLPGGHRARGMRSYLESEVLQQSVAGAFAADLSVAAICHGVLLAARSVDPATGRSVLYGRRTTALTWSLERKAWHLARVARFWDPDYYRTYRETAGQPPGYMSVQQEVIRALAGPDDFVDVPADAREYSLKTSGRARDTPDDDRPAFVVTDGSYVSARWPGDAHTFARRFAEVLEDKRAVAQATPPPRHDALDREPR